MKSALSQIAFFVYRHLLVPVTILILKLVYPFSRGKLREFLADRFESHWVPLNGKTIWVHASSGEIEYAKPVIRHLKELWPQRPIVMTYFSPSAKRLIKNMSGIDAIVALPWDSPKYIRGFIGHFNPEMLLISRTDVWPELAYQCRQHDIVSYLFSATFSRHSSRRGLFATPLTRFALDQLDEIYCVSDEDVEEIQKVGTKTKLTVAGDTRFDQVQWRLSHPHPIKKYLKPENREGIFIAGSTWPADEEIILPALKDFLDQGGRAIIAPHVVTGVSITALETRIAQFKYSYQSYSRINKWDSQILIVDQIGCLQELYTWAEVAFVGGSFKDKIHSVMEPLVAGCPVITGPYYKNNREAILFSQFQIGEVQLVSMVRNKYEFARKLAEVRGQIVPLAKLLNMKLSQQFGATEKLVKSFEMPQ